MKSRNCHKSKAHQLKSISNQAALIFLALIIAVSSAACGEHSENSTAEQSENDNAGEVIYYVDGTDSEELISADEEKGETNSFNMLISGDYIIYDSMYYEAHARANGNGYDFSAMVENLRQFTEKCDVNYYNQETILGGSELGVSSYPSFNSPQEAGDAMVDLGYNLVSTATNHSLDCGEAAVLSSREYWNSKEDVFMTGTFESQAARDEVHVLECNGITYTMLNYTYATNGIPVPDGKDYLVNIWPTDLAINDPESDAAYQKYKEQVKADIEAIRDKVDFLIVAIHAGVEYEVRESAYQRDMAQFLADNGVNLVIGTHPHVIEPAEYIGDTLVYYSLGNLLCAQMQDENYNKVTSVLATFTVNKTEENGETKITFDNMDNQLMYSYYNQATWSDYRVIPFSSNEIKAYLPNYKSVHEQYKSNFLALDDSLPVADCAK